MKKHITRSIFLFSILTFSFMSHASGYEWILGFCHPELYVGRISELTRAEADQEEAELQALAATAEDVALTALIEEAELQAPAATAEAVALTALNDLDDEDETLNDSQGRDEDCVQLSEEECENVCFNDAENNDPRFKPRFKIELCFHFKRHGNCRFGDGCHFAHGDRELRIRHENCKKQLCKNWFESGQCRYGKRCNFAHGPSELRK